ncbi:MAG: CoB--CoM heterodisulfide reductase 1 iron-sulfur subunit C [Promethearchaeota archaeon]|nr:MAG: CoB--CoM heterodisulfide reductase 1 iron-sulfur subunit C [Candidatus Lokiarchaeota archaeon]
MNENVEKYIERDVYKELNSTLADKLRDAGFEKILTCINCGTCTGSCPSGRRTAFRTRVSIRRALMGDIDVLKDIDIWLCSTCYYCYERCPRGIPVTDMIIKLRNIAVEEGFILDTHLTLADDIFYETGHGVPATGEDNKKWRDLREAYSLPRLPPTVHSHPEAIEECQTLMDNVGFRDLLNHAREVKIQENREEDEMK